MGTNKKSKDSTLALHKLLSEIVDGSSFYNINDFKLTLRSQGALTKYSNKDLGITPQALNTLKKSADKFLAGGFLRLNALRIEALAMSKKNTVSSRTSISTKADLKKRTDELQSNITILNQDLLKLSMAIDSAMNCASKYVILSKQQFLADLWSQERQEILAILSMIFTKKDG